MGEPSFTPFMREMMLIWRSESDIDSSDGDWDERDSEYEEGESKNEYDDDDDLGGGEQGGATDKPSSSVAVGKQKPLINYKYDEGNYDEDSGFEVEPDSEEDLESIQSSDEDVVEKPLVFYPKDMEKPPLQYGLTFSSRKECKEAIRRWNIRRGRRWRFKKNDKWRIKVVCQMAYIIKDGKKKKICDWEIFVSMCSGSPVVTTFVPRHKCKFRHKNKSVTSTIAVAWSVDKDPMDFVDPCYSVLAYQTCYQPTIKPMRGELEWEKAPGKPLLAPLYGRGPGRPKRNKRKKTLAERIIEKDRKQKLSRSGQKITCSSCQILGHNKRTCPSRKASQGTQNDQVEIQNQSIETLDKCGSCGILGHNEITCPFIEPVDGVVDLASNFDDLSNVVQLDVDVLSQHNSLVKRKVIVPDEGKIQSDDLNEDIVAEIKAIEAEAAMKIEQLKKKQKVSLSQPANPKPTKLRGKKKIVAEPGKEHNKNTSATNDSIKTSPATNTETNTSKFQELFAKAIARTDELYRMYALEKPSSSSDGVFNFGINQTKFSPEMIAASIKRINEFYEKYALGLTSSSTVVLRSKGMLLQNLNAK
ncbi:OLC1v1035804C1 [Oldenlandia corymbosa var. corymbosa]|uniref:OLC1v1035804C1 n=1 Tax=Oldenlandia corymbosa var. corymbosa TaxID=529605 RepID=A0AAV1CX00_OLDCO|nr:OLC1v1035804C1 [Oldenlandia corymbosa var. corymbosa]